MKAALFLGAGASKFVGHPTTKELMHILQERIHDDKAMSEITKTIIKSSGYTDIEQLYDGIDRILRMRDGKDGIPNIKQIIRALYDNDGTFKTALDELERLKSVIIDILREQLVVDDGARESIVQMYGMVMSVIKDHVADGLRVFTTNYDMVVEAYAKETCRELVNGFQRRRNTDDVWDNGWDGQTKKPLYLVKLHGSMNWYEDDGDVLDANNITQRTADHSVLIAPTEGPKDYGRKPFLELQKHFEKEMSGVDVLLVIGFSYRDEEIVKIIKKSLKDGMALISVSPNAVKDIRRVSTGVKHAIVVVDEQFKTDCNGVTLIEQKFEPDTINDLRTQLKGVFGSALDHAKRARPKNDTA